MSIQNSSFSEIFFEKKVVFLQLFCFLPAGFPFFSNIEEKTELPSAVSSSLEKRILLPVHQKSGLFA